MQRSFYEILEDRKAAGRTVFFSSHILSEVERVCDRVAIVRQGELVALSDVGELLRRHRRRVELRLDGAAPDLSRVPGISDVEISEDVLTCQLEGDPMPLVAALQGVGICVTCSSSRRASKRPSWSTTPKRQKRPGRSSRPQAARPRSAEVTRHERAAAPLHVRVQPREAAGHRRRARAHGRDHAGDVQGLRPGGRGVRGVRAPAAPVLQLRWGRPLQPDRQRGPRLHASVHAAAGGHHGRRLPGAGHRRRTRPRHAGGDAVAADLPARAPGHALRRGARLRGHAAGDPGPHHRCSRPTSSGWVTSSTSRTWSSCGWRAASCSWGSCR